jgi:hypothetical protein
MVAEIIRRAKLFPRVGRGALAPKPLREAD